MATAIRITISLGDAREGIDRILDNPYFECLQRTATNQWESERFDDEDEDEADDLYELKETLTHTLAGLDYDIEDITEFDIEY
ncbi:hypothetical protein [Prevotella sp.]|nr:hypothetical protein [Prevotella sp.]UWG72946.1 MAG: hypothetical protein [Bacteriophage sp.]DAW40427.1 MAG TPA: hypothetical protein [Caudoviricetes sp.]